MQSIVQLVIRFSILIKYMRACKNTDAYVAKRHAICRSIPLPLPITDVNDVVNAMCSAWNENVKLLLLDHICSPSGWVLPIEEIVAFFEERGTMVWLMVHMLWDRYRWIYSLWCLLLCRKCSQMVVCSKRKCIFICT